MSGTARTLGSSGAVTIVAAAVLVYALTDDPLLDNVSYLGVMIAASIGAWVGAERAPTGQRLVPRLIAAGVTLTALGDVTWSILDWRGLSTDVSLADPPWFASYVFLCAAVWIVLRGSRTDRRVDLDFAVDAATIVAVSVMIFWSTSVEAIVADRTLSPVVRAVWAAYPIADAVLLALVARVVLSRAGRRVIDAPFAVGVALWLAADITYLHAPTEGVIPVLMDTAWMVAPVLLARSAWTVRGVPRPTPTSSSPSDRRWVAQLVVAVAPLFVPPALELVNDLRGRPDQPVQLFVGTTFLIGLAFVRTARLIRSEQDALRELEQARDAALSATRAKSMFVATMSHEIRTPLTSVLATGELLEDTRLDDLQCRLLQRLNRSGQQLKVLVEDILDFSRIEAGHVSIAASPFDLHATVTHLVEAFGPRQVQTGVALAWCVDPAVPRWVVGDSARLEQVLGNLLDNAFKFTAEGQIRLLVREGVEFAVEDTGIGMADHDLTHVFESFHQVDGSTTRRYGGSGLGLSISKELTQRMGGSITVTSRVDEGSTFVVRIPLPPAETFEPRPSE